MDAKARQGEQQLPEAEEQQLFAPSPSAGATVRDVLDAVFEVTSAFCEDIEDQPDHVGEALLGQDSLNPLRPAFFTCLHAAQVD